jgi:hypothetical protein
MPLTVCPSRTSKQGIILFASINNLFIDTIYLKSQKYR